MQTAVRGSVNYLLPTAKKRGSTLDGKILCSSGTSGCAT